MGVSAIPERFPATGTDAAVSITRAVTKHRIGVCLAFHQQLDADRLARAVRLSLDAEPILGCAFRTDAFKAYWRRIADLDAVDAFSMLETDDPDREMVAFQAEAIRDEGPQAAVRLFRSAAGDVLGVKVSHVIADGHACKQYAYLLASVYTRLGEDPSFAPEPDLQRRPTAKDVWSNLDSEQRRHAKTAKSWAMPNWDVPTLAVNGQGLTYRSFVLKPERFLAVKDYGRLRSATVNDMLLTAFFRASITSFDPPAGKPLSLMCTADLRRYLPNRAHLPIDNMSISSSLDIERVADESFDDTLGRVRRRMAAWANQCFGAGPAFNAEKLTALGYKMTKWMLEATFKMAGGPGKTYPWFTNIGVLDESQLRFDGRAPVSGSMYGPSAFGPSIVPTVSTYRNALTFRMGFCAKDINPDVVDGVLRLTNDELQQLLHSAPPEGS